MSVNESSPAVVWTVEGGGEVIAAIVIAFILSPIIVLSNAILLAGVRRSKRLRSSSNLLLCSLAISDLGTGLILPACIYVYLTDAYLCLPVLCTATTLSISSLVTMAAIAVDKFTSLAQPLQYNNIMTHAWTSRMLFCCWLYSIMMGFSPAIYQCEISTSCTFTKQVDEAIQAVLLCCVYGPCCCIVVPCYWYMYIVARQHARAINTVEVSIRGPHQGCASRYAQTLALTVGCFLLLWAPYQCGMVIDLITGSDVLTGWGGVYLSLPIFANSAVNPWVYGFRNTEIRVAVRKLLGSPVVPTIQVAGTQADAAELFSYASHTMRILVSPNRNSSILLTHRPPESTYLTVPVCYAQTEISSTT